MSDLVVLIDIDEESSVEIVPADQLVRLKVAHSEQLSPFSEGKAYTLERAATFLCKIHLHPESQLACWLLWSLPQRRWD